MQIDYEAWRKPKPLGISACIRVRNESQFMSAAVRSILPLVDEVVLCVQPSDDNTVEIAERMADADESDKIKVYYYSIVPAWIDTPEFYSKDPNSEGHLVHMSNWALSKCSYSWILKIEGDVIALPYLSKMLEKVRQSTEPKYYGLVILNVAGPLMDKISLENPRNGGWDEAIFPNHPDICRFERAGKWEVVIPKCDRESLGWALLHMKRSKAGKDNAWNGETYIDWTDDNVRPALEKYNSVNPYPAIDGMPLGFPQEIGKDVIMTEYAFPRLKEIHEVQLHRHNR